MIPVGSKKSIRNGFTRIILKLKVMAPGVSRTNTHSSQCISEFFPYPESLLSYDFQSGL